MLFDVFVKNFNIFTSNIIDVEVAKVLWLVFVFSILWCS
jgi:hypothetical protein